MIIDGILGVGARLPMKEDVRKILKWINGQSGKTVAIDIPTGVLANEGKCDQNAYRADMTIVLHGYKPSCFLFPSSDYYGKLYIADIGLPHESKWKVWTKADVLKSWPKSKTNSHKGTYGNGLLIAGSDSMPGSVALASIGAMRFGIGKLSVATSKHASLFVGAQVPEATFIYEPLQDIKKMEIEKKFSCLAVGPGLEPDDPLEQLITELLPMDIPKILDAGALRGRDYSKSQNHVIVTPHPGEFSRMTGLETKFIQENRLQVASQYSMKHRVIVVLKGQYTVIAFPDGSGLINLTGNRALSKGGSGDILTGMLLASVGIHSNVQAAVANAVYLHGACADLWVQSNGSAAMTAHDFQRLLPVVCKEMEKELEE
ncbi:NAD(P)H-hydrate dehydratase [Bacillus sp. FSL W8-1127]